MVVERTTLVDAVWNATATQRLLHHSRLIISAIQNHNLVPAITRFTQALTQSGCNHLALLTIGCAAHNLDFLARVALRVALLLHTARVALDDRVGGIHDGLRRAVVLLELKGLRRGVVLAEGEDVLNLRATERVDTLGIVAHHAHPAVLHREAADDDILRIVGVLILIHEDVLELLLILRQHLGAVAQQDVGLQQQVIEIHRTICLAAAAILHIDIAELGHLQLPVLGGKACVRHIGTRGHKGVLGIGDAR